MSDNVRIEDPEQPPLPTNLPKEMTAPEQRNEPLNDKVDRLQEQRSKKPLPPAHEVPATNFWDDTDIASKNELTRPGEQDTKLVPAAHSIISGAPSGTSLTDKLHMAKMIADKWAEGGANALKGAATHIYDTIQRWEQDPTLPSSRGDTDIGKDAFALGPGMLMPGFGRAAGGVGALGGVPPKVTALVSAQRGKPEFEALADQIYEKLKGVRSETIKPAAYELNASGVLKHDSPEGLALSKLQRQTDAENLGEVAERAAAWQLYKKQLGGEDFELGAFGSRPGYAKYAHTLSPNELGEMNALLKKHPQHADEIRASYGLEATDTVGPKVSITKNKGEQPQRLAPSTLPQTPPVKSGPVPGGERALSEDMLVEARQRMGKGESGRSVAEDLGVHHETLRDRLANPYSTKTQDEAFRSSPRASALNDDHVRQLMLTMKRSGETDAAIAAELGKRLSDKKITTNMVTSQLRTMRTRGLRAGGVPTPRKDEQRDELRAR